MSKSYTNIKDLLSSPDAIFSANGKDQMNSAKRVYMLWYKVNGNFERKHTTGLYLKEPVGKEQYPTLIVYIDKNIVMQDFRTNKQIYLIRLKAEGLILRDIEFLLSKPGHKSRKPVEIEPMKKKKKKLPELTEEEMAQIESLTADLSEETKQIVTKPMISAFRRRKLQSMEEALKRS